MSIIWSNPVNRLHPLNRGLVSWWLVTPNARGGTTFRDLAGQNHGTLTNMDPATDWVISNRRVSWGALDFDGTDDYVVAAGNSSQENLSTHSVVAWINPDVVVGTKVIIEKWTGVSAVDYNIFLSGSSLRTYKTSTFTSGLTVTAGQWAQVGMTYDGSDNRIFKDGVFSTSSLSQLYSSSSSDITIGDRSTNTFYFNGQLDDIRLYNRALSATEARQLYNLSSTGYGDLLNRRRRVFKAPAAAGGGNAMPMAMHHYRQRRVG